MKKQSGLVTVVGLTLVAAVMMTSMGIVAVKQPAQKESSQSNQQSQQSQQSQQNPFMSE